MGTPNLGPEQTGMRRNEKMRDAQHHILKVTDSR